MAAPNLDSRARDAWKAFEDPLAQGQAERLNLSAAVLARRCVHEVLERFSGTSPSDLPSVNAAAKSPSNRQRTVRWCGS